MSGNSWPVLFTLIRPERNRLSAAIALGALAAGAELLPPILLARSAELALNGAAVGLLGMAGWMAAALVLKYALYSLAYFFSHVAAYRLLAGIRQMLVRRLAWAPLAWLQRFGSGQLKKTVLQDVERLEQFIAHHTVELVAATAAPLLAALALALLDWRLALAALAPLPLAALAQAVLMRGFRARVEEFDHAAAELNGAAIEYVRSLPVMKAFRQDAASFSRMREGLARYHRSVTAVTRQTVPGWSAFLVLLGANAVFLVPLGLWLHGRGMLAPWQVLLALMLGTGMLKPLFKVARFSSEIREILAGIRRMEPFLGWRPPETRPPTVAAAPPDVVFDGVGFSYDGRPVLRDLSLTLPAGRLTALVGPSGAGKSTVAHLLGGLVPPDQGDIRIGGLRLAALDERDRAALVNVAAQEAFLFRGTLLENLKLARPDADDPSVREAIRIAQAEAFIDALPDGWHTLVGERGTRLSGGERQRIAVARALLGRAPVLVLDEATAFADSRTEKRFHHALRAARPDATLLVIAHRLTAIEQADQIVVLQDGAVRDSGRHDDLLSRCPLYRTLWDRQFESESWTLRDAKAADAARH